MQVILVVISVPGGYGPAPAGYTTTSRYRAAMAARNERGIAQLWDIMLVAVIAISRHFSDVALFIQHLPPAQRGLRFSFLLISHPKYITGNK